MKVRLVVVRQVPGVLKGKASVTEPSTLLLMHPDYRKAISCDGRSVTSGFEVEDEYRPSVE